MKMSFGKNASRIYLNKSGDRPKKGTASRPIIVYEEEIFLELETNLDCRSSQKTEVMAICRQIAQTSLRFQC